MYEGHQLVNIKYIYLLIEIPNFCSRCLLTVLNLSASWRSKVTGYHSTEFSTSLDVGLRMKEVEVSKIPSRGSGPHEELRRSLINCNDACRMK